MLRKKKCQLWRILKGCRCSLQNVVFFAGRTNTEPVCWVGPNLSDSLVFIHTRATIHICTFALFSLLQPKPNYNFILPLKSLSLFNLSQSTCPNITLPRSLCWKIHPHTHMHTHIWLYMCPWAITVCTEVEFIDQQVKSWHLYFGSKNSKEDFLTWIEAMIKEREKKQQIIAVSGKVDLKYASWIWKCLRGKLWTWFCKSPVYLRCWMCVKWLQTVSKQME